MNLWELCLCILNGDIEKTVRTCGNCAYSEWNGDMGLCCYVDGDQNTVELYETGCSEWEPKEERDK